MLRKTIATALVVSTLACGTAQAGDHTGALLGGLAIGAVGGAIVGSALAQPHPVYAPQPVYMAPPPPPHVVYVQAAPSPYDQQMFNLHASCDAGDRHACVRFGILIGQHQERVADWRRAHPDFFTY